MKTLIIFIISVSLFLQISLNEASYQDKMTYDELESILNKPYESSDETNDVDYYRLERELKSDQNEEKKIGSILNNIRKQLVEYIVEKEDPVPSNSDTIRSSLNEMAQKDKKEKKLNRLPFKWGK